MTQAAIATRGRTFNPKQFNRDFHQLSLQNPKKATKLAADWRERLENALIEAESATAMVIELAVVGGSNLAFTTMSGFLDAKRNDIITRWRSMDANDEYGAKGAEYADAQGLTPDQMQDKSPFKDGDIADPTTFGMVPISLWVTGGSGVLAFLTRNTQWNYLTRGLLVGGLTSFTGELGRDLGVRMYEKRQEGDDE